MTWRRRYKNNPPAKINTIRFFCGLKPVFLLSKDSSYLFAVENGGVHAKDIYPVSKYHRTKVRYIYKAMTDEDKWSEGDIISLPQGLCFGSISKRYFKSSNPKTILLIKLARAKGWI